MKILIVKYQPKWAKDFEQIQEALFQILDPSTRRDLLVKTPTRAGRFLRNDFNVPVRICIGLCRRKGFIGNRISLIDIYSKSNTESVGIANP